jgi:hypothetical protein
MKLAFLFWCCVGALISGLAICLLGVAYLLGTSVVSQNIVMGIASVLIGVLDIVLGTRVMAREVFVKKRVG